MFIMILICIKTKLILVCTYDIVYIRIMHYVYIYIYIYIYLYIYIHYVGTQSVMLNAIIQPTSSENKIYKRYRKNCNMVVSINLTPSWAFCIISTISFLLFNRFCFLYVAISNFLFKHSRQRFICELYGTHFFTISHLTFV